MGDKNYYKEKVKRLEKMYEDNDQLDGCVGLIIIGLGLILICIFV
jgi:hypothetical protein